MVEGVTALGIGTNVWNHFAAQHFCLIEGAHASVSLAGYVDNRQLEELYALRQKICVGLVQGSLQCDQRMSI